MPDRQYDGTSSNLLLRRVGLHGVRTLVLIGSLAFATPGRSEAQQPPSPVAVQFRVGEDTIRGRFFASAASAPLATLILIPGFGGDTTDVLGLGARLSAGDVNVLIFNNRGVQNSGGTLTYLNALDDAAAALAWVREPGTRARFRIDPARVVLGGHSFGGAIAILHAARDTSVRRVLSIAGADHGTYARRIRMEPDYRAAIRQVLAGARAPQGPVRLDPDAIIDDIVANEARYSHPPHAARFVGRAVLLIGGWDDGTCPIERELLPMYRALKAVPGAEAAIVGYPDGHSFRASRERMAEDIRAWLQTTVGVGTAGR